MTKSKAQTHNTFFVKRMENNCTITDFVQEFPYVENCAKDLFIKFNNLYNYAIFTNFCNNILFIT